MYTSERTTTRSDGFFIIKKFMQRLCLELTSSKCVLDEYNTSNLNDILLSGVNNDSISLLLNLFTSMRER